MIPPAVLAPLLSAARQRWPGLTVDEAALSAALLERRPAGADPQRYEWLGGLHVSDLYLAIACLAGEPRAIAGLEALATPIAREVLERHPGGSMSTGDLSRTVVASLLVSTTGRPPKLGGYAGRGSLASFVRVCAIRLALDDAEARGRLVPLDDAQLADHAFSPSSDEELFRFKEIYRPAFTGAVRESLAALEPRSRNLLRLHYLERLPCERIAALYNVHTATAWRWIDKTHQELRTDILRRLADRLGAEAPDAESILKLVWSQLEDSLRVALNDDRPPP